MTESERKIEFFIKVREKFDEIEQLAQDFGLMEDYLSVLCVGILDKEDVSEDYEDDSRFRVEAISSIFADSEQEMMSLLSHLVTNFDEEPEDTRSIDFWLGEGGSA